MARFQPAEKESQVERTVKLNSMGEATVVFTNEELRTHNLVMDYGGSAVRIVASVTEDLTEIQRNATAQVSQNFIIRLSIKFRWSLIATTFNWKLRSKETISSPVFLTMLLWRSSKWTTLQSKLPFHVESKLPLSTIIPTRPMSHLNTKKRKSRS